MTATSEETEIVVDGGVDDEQVHLICVVCAGARNVQKLDVIIRMICGKQILTADWLALFKRVYFGEEFPHCQPCHDLYDRHVDRCETHRNDPLPPK